MAELDLVLGIDSSTQSTSAVILSRLDYSVLSEARVRYRDDPRLRGFGLADGSPTLAAEEPGEASQPAALFLAALEALLDELPRELLSRVAAIDLSAQQHGQVWLGDPALKAIAGLGKPGSGEKGAPSLAQLLGPGLSWERAPIWMSANTVEEAAALRDAAGGALAMTERSGSDSPLRFSGAVLMRSARQHPHNWEKTVRVHLISSFLSGVLSANPDCPIDWGNGSGTSLMNWHERTWDGQLVRAAGEFLGDPGLAGKLPGLAHPLSVAGNLARRFVERYGMSPLCRVLIGSGDNPQSKVLVPGSLLSLGTSFVLMTAGGSPHVSANAMYDGLGLPFIFGCRTNGALAWERVRRDHGFAADDFAAAEAALLARLPALPPVIFQPERESFPDSPALDEGRSPDFAADYAGVVDSSLSLMWLASRSFAGKDRGMAVTGGASASAAVLARVAAIWKVPVVPIADAGAAAGAALAAALSLLSEGERASVADDARRATSRAGSAVEPDPGLMAAFHGPNGYLAALEARLLPAR
ncbi:MAG: sugar kinase [Spirochaetota bacterium]